MSDPSSARTTAGLYIHIPFCSAICPYCDFAVTTGTRSRRLRYVDCLLDEIALYRGYPLVFDTIYFGGGTPSALDPEDLRRILDALGDALAVASEAWISLEANPEDVNASSVAAWRALGVETVSLGLQSFNDLELKFLGRRHDHGVSVDCMRVAREAGFHTVSVDLIYGLPAQTPEAWGRNLLGAVTLRPDHVSCYQLTIHDATPFARRRDEGRLAELPEESQGELFELTHTVLEERGYEAYEVSNFARSPEHRSRHNQGYWNHKPYLGLGLSSHSYHGTVRWWNERELERYEGRVRAGQRPVADSEVLTPRDLALETMMLKLRTREGLDLVAFSAEYGIDLGAENAPRIESYVNEGLARISGESLQLTRRGFAMADAVARALSLGDDR